MKIITLLLALFLTLLPDSVPVSHSSILQEICTEDVIDIEEEAVIRISRPEQKLSAQSSDPATPVISKWQPFIPKVNIVHFCFERQWLTSLRLRL